MNMIEFIIVLQNSNTSFANHANIGTKSNELNYAIIFLASFFLTSKLDFCICKI